MGLHNQTTKVLSDLNNMITRKLKEGDDPFTILRNVQDNLKQLIATRNVKK